MLAVQGLLKNFAQPQSCTQVLANISSFLRSTRALTQVEQNLAAALEQPRIPDKKQKKLERRKTW